MHNMKSFLITLVGMEIFRRDIRTVIRMVPMNWYLYFVIRGSDYVWKSMHNADYNKALD